MPLEHSIHYNHTMSRKLFIFKIGKNKLFSSICCLLLPIIFLLSSEFLFAESELKSKIFVSILPQRYLVQRIAGDYADVEVLIPPGMSPHTFEPTPQLMARLTRSSILFAIGVSFEKALITRLKSVAPNLKIVQTDENIKKRVIEAHDAHETDETHAAHETHDDDHHSCEDDCSHEGALDPHIWLDPILLKTVSQNIAQALFEILPQHSDEIAKNVSLLLEELEELDSELSEALKSFRGEKMFVFHPAFGYFADRYGLKQMAIEIEGKEPTPRQLANIVRSCKKENVRVIFVQKQFPVRAAKTIAESIKGSVVLIDPLAENYFENLKEIKEKLLLGIPNEKK